MDKKVSSEPVVKDIRSRTRKKDSSEEKICIVIDGLRGEDSIPSLYRREGWLYWVLFTALFKRVAFDHFLYFKSDI